MKYQRILGFIICICSIVFVLCSCRTAEDYEAFEELTTQCVEEDQSVMLELYDMYENNIITGISQTNDTNVGGITIEYNDKQYHVFMPEETNNSTQDCLRACEIVDHLINKYPITDINYYDNLGKMELWFDENFYGMNWAIIYYPPDIEPDEDVPGYDHTEEIKNGFYRYYCYPGF